MNIWEKESFEHSYNGQTFKITKLGIDISSEWDKNQGMVEITHKIEGFPVDLYMVTDMSDNSFGFCHRVIEDGYDTGMFVTLQDEDIFNQACELVANIDVIK